MPTHLPRLYDHLVWADHRTLESIEALASQGLPHERPVALMAHLIGASYTWMARIQDGQSPLPIWPEFSLAECKSWLEECHERMQLIMTSLDATELSRSVHYANSAGQEFVNTVHDILTHLAMHGSYHRGQIALLVREAGGQPAATDFIAFARGADARTHR